MRPTASAETAVPNRNERQQGLSRTVRDSNCDVASAGIAEHVDRRHAADGAREMRFAAPDGAEHQLHLPVVSVEGGAEERIRELLRLRADLGVVHLERAATAEVAPGEVVELRAPLGMRERHDHGRLGGDSRTRHCSRVGYRQYATRRAPNDARRDAADEQTGDEPVAMTSRGDEIRAHAGREREKLCRRIALQEHGLYRRTGWCAQLLARTLQGIASILLVCRAVVLPLVE